MVQALTQKELDISIVIPCYKDKKVFNCIKSIDEKVEVIVVINPPSIEIEELINFNFPSVVIFNQEQPNLALARNNGFQLSKKSNVLFIDSDCIFTPGAIRKIYKGLANASLSKGLVRFEKKSKLTAIVSIVREYHTSAFPNAYAVPLGIRKDVITKLDGYLFDINLHWYEDFDLDFRARKGKLDLIWIKDAEIIHKPINVIADLKAAYHYGLGKAIFDNKHKDILKLNKKHKSNQALVFTRMRKRINYIGIIPALYYSLWVWFLIVGDKVMQRRIAQQAKDHDILLWR